MVTDTAKSALETAQQVESLDGGRLISTQALFSFS